MQTTGKGQHQPKLCRALHHLSAYTTSPSNPIAHALPTMTTTIPSQPGPKPLSPPTTLQQQSSSARAPQQPPQQHAGLRTPSNRKTIYDRNLNRTRTAELSRASFAYLFSEMVTYAQRRVTGIQDLERRYFYTCPCSICSECVILDGLTSGAQVKRSRLSPRPAPPPSPPLPLLDTYTSHPAPNTHTPIAAIHSASIMEAPVRSIGRLYRKLLDKSARIHDR